MIINENLVKKTLEDLVSAVEYFTGWDAHLSDLKIELITREQYWERGMKPMYDILGIDMETKTMVGKINCSLTKKFMPYFPLGQYESLTGKIILIPENFSGLTNENGFATVLGHELVHRCQCVNNPKFIETYYNLIKKAIGTSLFEKNDFKDISYYKYLKAYGTLIEGDASFVQGQLKMIYRNAAVVRSFMPSFMRLFLYPFLKEKLDQYKNGKKIVAGFYKIGGREEVNKLYGLDVEKLYLYSKHL